jgi:hypothetical protein
VSLESLLDAPVRESPPPDETTRRPSFAPSIGSVLAPLLLLAALGIELAVIRVGLDPQDEGYFVEQATRILRGQLPYRDFDSLYTPALLYLHATLFQVLGGPEVIAVRAVGFVSRVVLIGGLYAICRPLMRPLVAVLPGLFILLALDRVPAVWEPHPGWPSAALTVLTVCVLLRSGPRPNWRVLLLLGALTAVTFAFKQNTGVFLGMAVVACTAWCAPRVTWPMRVVQWLVLALFVVATAWLIHAHASPVVAAYFLVPMLAAALACMRLSRTSSTGTPLRSWLLRMGVLAIGFVALTVPWLLALLRALDGNVSVLTGFVGGVEQDFLWSPLAAPTGYAWASVLGFGLCLVLAVHLRRSFIGVTLSTLLAVGFWIAAALLTAEPGDPTWKALLVALPRASYGLLVLLPAVGTVVASIYATRHGASWRVRALLVASALALLVEYPRMDEVHLAWSGCLGLAAAAWLLDRGYSGLVRRWRVGWGAALWASLLCVPLLAALPNVAQRLDGVVTGSGQLRSFQSTYGTGLSGVDDVLVSVEEASTLINAARYVREVTAPGEPIFAYPISPLFYVMTDRPNPTRFAHLFPGTATNTQIDDIVARLENARVRVVVVSSAALDFVGRPGSNQPLEDYLATRYREADRFGDYRVLVRR